MSKMGYLQMTLALIKPDIAANPNVVQTIEKLILRNKFFIIRRKNVRWNKRNAERFYQEHAGRVFHKRLVEFMSSGPIIALILARDNAIPEWRKLMGPTKVYQARFTHPNTIRGQFGLTDTRNSVHGSDSKKSLLKETTQFFPEFDISKWYEKEEHFFRNEEVAYNVHAGIHVASTDSERHTADISPSAMGNPDAWSAHYEKKTEPMEWFTDYDGLHDYLASIFRQNKSYKSVVDVGCGLSLLGPNLAEQRPYLDVYCMDVSANCLQTLASSRSHGNCTFVVGDVRQYLPFETNSVDLVIDKGTMDAITRHDCGRMYGESMMNEIRRVLSQGGTLLQITTEVPEVRLDELNALSNIESVSFSEMQCISNGLPVYTYEIKFS